MISMQDKTKIEEVVEKFKSLSIDEKRAASMLLRREWPFFDYDKYENPETTTENIQELQNKLVQLCIDYINEHGLKDIEEVHFNVDELQFSSKEGKWTPQTDSYIGVFGYQKDSITDYKVRKLIGDFF
jgi:hypothetical protein